MTAALKLEITPQITEAGTVVLHVIAENNSVNLAIATKSAPGINTQRAETTVLVPDGGTTVAMLGLAFAGLGATRRFLKR